jgi:phage-related minor tail protein
MPQRFYLNETDLNGTLEKMDQNLMEMLDFAYLHEDMVNTIEELMSDWAKENLPSYSEIIKEYENMNEEEKDFFDDIDDYISSELGRWWIESFDNLDDEMKKNVIHRYRLTIATCLHSNTYMYEDLMNEINESYENMMV